MRGQLITCSIVLIFFSLFNTALSQTNQELLSKTWRFTMDTSITEFDAKGVAPIPPAVQKIALAGFRFKVVGFNGADLVIKFIPWPSNTANRNTFNTTSGINPHERNFLLTKGTFDSCCEEYTNRKPKVIVGITIMPIKIRFVENNPPWPTDGSTDGPKKVESIFECNFSIGLSAGAKWNFNKGKWGISGIGGFALSSVAVTPETTDNTVTTNTNAAAITIHAGCLVNVDNFQIGLITGIDYLSGKLNRNWLYKNRPWVGIGMGFSIFTAKGTTSTQ